MSKEIQSDLTWIVHELSWLTDFMMPDRSEREACKT
jgi:hypothetical protein